MSFWKKTYVITALCMIAAGLIYLMLPLSKDYESFQKSEEQDEISSVECLTSRSGTLFFFCLFSSPVVSV